jgi:predicted  nucleic acid-binding Zn-ribbon protein
MKDTIKIALISLAIILLITTVAIVGIVGLQQQNDTASRDLSEFKGEMIDLNKVLEDERLKNQNAQQQLSQLQDDLQVVIAQNQSLQEQQQPQQTSGIVDYGEILVDINRLTLANCPNVIAYARAEERDLRYQRDDITDRLDRAEERLDERELDLAEAIGDGDSDRVRTHQKRVDSMEDQVDDIQDELNDFDDLEYSRIRHLRSRADSWCRRLERNL